MIRNVIVAAVGLLLVTVAVVGAVAWFAFRVYVPEDKCAVLIRKTGDQLPPGQLLATEPGQKGIQEEVLGPGRYFYNPYTWDYKLENLTIIPSGDPSTWEWVHSLSKQQRDALRAGTFEFRGEFPQIGVVTRKVGKQPAPGQVIVKRKSGVQGILEEVLTPGTYKINPYVYDVQKHPAVVIPAGFIGVVTNLFGDQPETTQKDTLPELGYEPADLPKGDTETELRAPSCRTRGARHTARCSPAWCLLH